MRFHGRVRADRRTIDVDDAALSALAEIGGLVWIDDASGDTTCGEIAHDGSVFVVRADAQLTPRADDRGVTVRPRGTRSAA